MRMNKKHAWEHILMVLQAQERPKSLLGIRFLWFKNLEKNQRVCLFLIRYVNDLSLKSILYTMTRLEGSIAPHISSETQMQYAIECMTLACLIGVRD